MICLDPQVLKMQDGFASAKSAWQTRNDYRAARQTRFSRKMHGVYPSGSSADQHLQSEYKYHLIAERAEDIDRNDVVLSQGIDTKCVNILQCGYQLDPKTGNPDADMLLKEAWTEWAEDPQQCDFQGEFTFNTLSWLALRGATVRGDILGLPIFTGHAQLVENYRLRTPRSKNHRGDEGRRIVYGVQLDQHRRRQGYWLTKDDISVDEFVGFKDSAYYVAHDDDGHKQVFHVYHPKRYTQTRGITPLANSMDTIGMHDDIHFAKLVQQQGVSNFMVIRERPMGFDMPDGVTEDYSTESDPCRAGQTRQIRHLSPGTWYTGYPGEVVKGFSPNVPNPTFFDHQKQTLQLIALSIDLPLILFLMDASETNFSGWRGAMDVAKMKFRRYQKWFADVWHKQFYSWKVRQWTDPQSPLVKPDLLNLASGLGARVFAHEWVFPSWPYVQIGEEVKAEATEQQNHLNSPRRIQSRHGRDWDNVSTEIVEDNAMLIVKAKTKAKEINSQFPEDKPVTWREIAGMATPEGTQINLGEADEEKEEPQPVGAGANANSNK